MRYLRWVLSLLILLVIILQIFYNFKNFTDTDFQFAFQLLPGRVIFETELPVWQGLLFMFILGLGVGILFEVYHWAKWTLRLRSQSKIINRLEKALESLMPAHAAEHKPQEPQSDDATVKNKGAGRP